MKYGRGFWVVRNGARLADPSSPYAYPATRGFRYADGDAGEFLTEPFTLDYVPPGSYCETRGVALRMTFAGHAEPILHRNAFDFDFASVPKVFRSVTLDKADHRIRVPSLGHDMGYCVHSIRPETDKRFWDTFLVEVMEAYCLDASAYARARDAALRRAVHAAVVAGGPFCWSKPAAEIETYRKLFKIEEVPV